MLSQVLSLTIFGGPLTVLTVEQALKSDQIYGENTEYNWFGRC